MKESDFIDQNKDKWLEYESIIKRNQTDPDKLSEVFIQVTDDLSHSRSHYPNRSVRVYLNDLASKIFDKLGKRKKLNFRVIRDFYALEVPQLMYLARREMLISFGVFIISMIIGIYSSIQNPEFASVVLGEGYVQMTKENISNGEAMAVYTGGGTMEGFLRILENNARIDVMMLGLGLFFSFGALWVLIKNGIMVGVFQFFFVQHGGFKDSLLTIWLHGTIEITTIALMGGVALLAGKGLLFPGNYTRYQSFRLSAGNAAKLLLMVLPFTFVAAVIEGFITRMTGMPDVIKAFFILLSLAVVVVYFFVYPRIVHRKHGVNPIHEKLRKEHPSAPIDPTEVKSPAKIISEAFITYKGNFGKNVLICVIAAIGYSISVYVYFNEYFTWNLTPTLMRIAEMFSILGDNYLDNLSYQPEVPAYRLFRLIYVGFWAVILFFVNVKTTYKFKLSLKKLPQYVLIGILLAAANVLYFGSEVRFPMNLLTSFSVVVLFTFASAILLVVHYYDQGKKLVIKTVLVRVFNLVILWLGLTAVTVFIQLLANSSLTSFTVLALTDLLPLETVSKENVIVGVQIGIYFAVMMAMLPFYYYATHYHVLSILEKYEAISLKAEMKRLNLKRSE
ncbi:MAG: stage II sporulation protein M [Bacteroidia bacterium]|nr:stage II sporulation protein M [Bacteroidia bacterium]